MKFSKIVFWAAGIWGGLIGFLGVALAWQFAFMVIGSDPIRFRLMMLPAMAEKFIHVGGMTVLYLRGRMTAQQLAFNSGDLVLGLLFVIAFVKTAKADTVPGS